MKKHLKKRKALYSVLMLIISLAILFAVSGCKKNIGVKRIRDTKGVEIVLNPIEPCKINGRHVRLILEEQTVIDTESDDVAKSGLADILAFDADSAGNIYVLTKKPDPDFIFKFDPQGRFLTSFGRQGQGPGELQNPETLSFKTISDGTLAITGNSRLYLYDAEGTLIKTTPFTAEYKTVIPLPGGNHLAIAEIMNFDPQAEYIFQDIVLLCDSNLKEILEIDRAFIESPWKGKGLNAAPHKYSWGISSKAIVTAYQDRGYEIRIFDHGGRPVRIIKKRYKEIPFPDGYKKQLLSTFPPNIFKIYIPDSLPPLEYVFTDYEGRIFVATYETGEKSSERMFDIFNPEGVFIARASLPAPADYSFENYRAKARNRRLYCLREKPSGYKELVVFKMKWE